MFLKPFRVKSNTTMRGSDRKKVRAEFGRQNPNVAEEQLVSMFPNKEDMNVMKICTHSGEDLLVYLIQQNPVLFEVEKRLYPTVYFLWSFPDVVPVLTTWPEVFKKLAGGADLMLPGVILPGGLASPTAVGNFPRNQCCAVNLRGNRAAVAVGRAAMSSMEMYEAGMRGKGIILMHIYGDHLWDVGNKSKLPDLPEVDIATRVLQAEPSADILSAEIDETAVDISQDSPVGDLVDRSVDSDLAAATEAACVVGDGPDDVIESGSCATGQSNERCCRTDDDVTVNNDADSTETTATSSSARASPDEMLHICFLAALKTTAKRIELPVLTSAFFRNYMVPCCPSDTTLDVKKSSYKKLSKFLSAMEKRGIIQVKELNKGVESIVSVNRESEELLSFRFPEWLPKPSSTTAATSASAAAETTSMYTPPTIVDMYRVTSAVLPLFKGKRKGDAMTAHEIRQHVTDYVKTNNLQDPDSRSSVVLDPTLTDCLLSRGDYFEKLRWEDMMERCCNKMTPCHQVTFPGGAEPQVRRGHVEPIELNVVQRGSNKKMTSVCNLDLFGIDCDEFASIVQKGVACSTSVAPRTDKPKAPQVLVQGNQISYIGQLLKELYQLPSKYIKGLDKAPKSSGHK